MSDPRPGYFITFEGGEGAGKSTQVKRLLENLKPLEREIVVTREPGGSPRAEMIRDLILSGFGRSVSPEAELLLFSEARQDHLNVLIRPALRRGAIVICDRFMDSTFAYQGAAQPAFQELLQDLEALIVEDTRPDLTFLLDLPIEIGLKRAQARRESTTQTLDRFESEDPTFHLAVRYRFLQRAAFESERFCILDARLPVEDLAQQIWLRVQGVLYTS